MLFFSLLKFKFAHVILWSGYLPTKIKTNEVLNLVCNIHIIYCWIIFKIHILKCGISIEQINVKRNQMLNSGATYRLTVWGVQKLYATDIDNIFSVT